MQPLILLHGAIGSSAQLQPVADLLQRDYTIYTLDFAGHGGRMISEGPLSIELFAREVLGFMEAQGLERVSIFGYSMGGYVAMYLAKHHPEKIGKIITLATKFAWDEAIAAKEVLKLDPVKTEQKVPAFAAALQQLHAPADWKKLMVKTAEMMLAMGRNNPIAQDEYAAINVPVLVMLGDRDRMVTMEETVAVYRSLPAGRLAILPDTAHPVDQADIATVVFMIRQFLAV